MRAVTHARRPARLIDGELQVLPAATATDCLIWFPVPVSAAADIDAEGVPAARIDDGHARLTGIPYFPYDVALGDELQINERDGELYAVEVTRQSPHVGVRIFDESSAITPEQALADPTSDDPFWALLRALALHDVAVERYSSSYAAFNVPGEEWASVHAFLQLHERTRGLQWECATPARASAHS